MATEIERKFRVINDAWRRQASAGVNMCQGYLASGQASSVRVRSAGGQAYLNLKSATLGVTRLEYEYAIPLADAEEMLDALCEQPLIEKTRYHVDHEGHRWDIDVFHGDNKGLIVAEIELNSEDEAFVLPEWAGAEVSHDLRYYNVSLVKHPYKDWNDR